MSWISDTESRPNFGHYQMESLAENTIGYSNSIWKKSRLNWKNYQPKSYFFSESVKNKFYEDMQTLSSFRNARNLALSQTKILSAASLLAKNLIKSGILQNLYFANSDKYDRIGRNRQLTDN